MKIGLTNITGRMGQAMLNAIQESDDFEVSVGFSRKESLKHPLKITQSITEILENSDLVIDFSVPLVSSLLMLAAQDIKKPLVIATTGFTDEELNLLRQTSKKVAVLQDSNMSIGINLINYLLPQVMKILGNQFDIDIIDKHHRNKIDSPSGTAKKFLEIISDHKKMSANDSIYNQNFTKGPRMKNSLGVSVIRAGNIFGEHEIEFTSNDEVIKLSHTALNRELFAQGALKAARWLINQPPGLYSMEDIIPFSETNLQSHG